MFDLIKIIFTKIIFKKPIMKESNYLWLFDNGHGGVIDGKYQTAGKRSPVWEDGSQLLEGVFNRAIVKRLMKSCTDAGIDCINRY
jgi:N-acetylmuramoyl-L-alanine amidase